MNSRAQKVERFRRLHDAGCFVIPNPWDAAGARMMECLGFSALATTSSGFAFSKGRTDGAGEVSQEESLGYASEIIAATALPVTADLEDGYAETPQGVAETVRRAAEAGLAGISIEDTQPDKGRPIRQFDDALERVAAAAEAARRYDIVLTARADGVGKGIYDLGEAIARLRAFNAAGADVLYAPGLPDLASVHELCRSVEGPVNHVVGQGVSGLTLEQIAEAGVRRVSVGGSLARAAGGALLGLCRQVARGDFAALEAAPTWSELRWPSRIL
jgi:2-methylisocitrate lyase-like PEP mutase family enzyme